MTLLLGADQVALYAPQGQDGHGWALPGAVAAWQGSGSLQRAPGRADELARDRGGHGPYDPAHSLLATLYLPPDAAPAEGMVALVAGQSFALSQVRQVTDPRGTGDLDCWVATATGTDDYGGQ